MSTSRRVDFHYFYVAYTFGQGVMGNVVIPQHKHNPFDPRSNEKSALNIAGATMYLQSVLGIPPLITFF
jgi:hypothetical protein